MAGLNFLALHDCNSITNKGLTSMSVLTNLDTLSLRGCRKLTNNGMETIKVCGFLLPGLCCLQAGLRLMCAFACKPLLLP